MHWDSRGRDRCIENNEIIKFDVRTETESSNRKKTATTGAGKLLFRSFIHDIVFIMSERIKHRKRTRTLELGAEKQDAGGSMIAKQSITKSNLNS